MCSSFTEKRARAAQNGPKWGTLGGLARRLEVQRLLLSFGGRSPWRFASIRSSDRAVVAHDRRNSPDGAKRSP